MRKPLRVVWRAAFGAGMAAAAVWLGAGPAHADSTEPADPGVVVGQLLQTDGLEELPPVKSVVTVVDKASGKLREATPDSPPDPVQRTHRAQRTDRAEAAGEDAEDAKAAGPSGPGLAAPEPTPAGLPKSRGASLPPIGPDRDKRAAAAAVQAPTGESKQAAAAKATKSGPVREAVRRATGPLSDVADVSKPIVRPAARVVSSTIRTATGGLASTTEPIVESAGAVTKKTAAELQPVTLPVLEKTGPMLVPAGELLAPVTDRASTTLKALVPSTAAELESVAAPVLQILAPVAAPVIEPLAPSTTPPRPTDSRPLQSVSPAATGKPASAAVLEQASPRADGISEQRSNEEGTDERDPSAASADPTPNRDPSAGPVIWQPQKTGTIPGHDTPDVRAESAAITPGDEHSGGKVSLPSSAASPGHSAGAGANSGAPSGDCPAGRQLSAPGGGSTVSPRNSTAPSVPDFDLGSTPD